jgi:hypothetical protein
VPLIDHLHQSIRQLVLDHLPYDRSDAALVAALHGMSADDLLIRWFNWVQRMVPPVPRQVLQSVEFGANPLVQQRQSDLQALIADIAAGADLTKYLSRGVEHGFVDPSGVKMHRRQDLDLMLSAWGIHHLHISQKVEPDGYVERDGPIIFAVFRRDRAYLIDLMTHKDWAREHVIRVIVNNWPNDGLVHEMKGVASLARTIDDEERLKLRKAQINTFIEIDGKVYGHTTGMTTAGSSIQAVRQADRVMIALKSFADAYERDPAAVIAQVSPGIAWPADPEFAVEFRPDAFGVSELKTNTFIRLGP